MSTPSTPKYKNYAELAAAFKSGELSSNYSIMLDKGGADARLVYCGTDDMADDEIDQKAAECKALFQPEYMDHILDLYAALGINVEWC